MERRARAAERRIGAIATALRSSSIATTLRSNATSAERAGRTEGAEGEGAEEFSVAGMPRGVPFGELWGEGPKFWGSADPANVEARERERAQAERELDGRIDGLGLRTAVDDFAEFGYVRARTNALPWPSPDTPLLLPAVHRARRDPA